MSTATPDEQYLREAISLAVANVSNGGGPFGAVVVTPDGGVFPGVNRVTATNDPTAHAEVVAIRAACTSIASFDLSGSVLYSSCEPCPMCLASALWARVDRVVYAADRNDAARAGFDDAVFYDYFSAPVEERSMPSGQLRLPASEGLDHCAPFDAWAAHSDRIPY
ncbi:nucleoside deaminase [Arthrobacter zhaoguopingii]|uniref:nucleoside deaminase n=1 Tax=Arthrobacter zhaoguopingii TaxID=2681491 RepID=UPI00135850E4|nr:nucleoside deaminase [Arthrobacter zhaoguopingii]